MNQERTTKVPTVSVIMPVFNGIPFVEEAVQSILEQTLSNFEFIIIDDGSDDGSAGLLDRLAAVDDRIQVIHQNNQGISAASNRGLGIARANYIALMDADDISLPHRLEAQVTFLDAHPEIGVLGSRVQVIDGAGKHMGDGWYFPQSAGVTSWRTLFRNCIVNPSVMMRRSVVREVGGYREGCGSYAQDYDLWTRLVPHTQLVNARDVLLKFRRWADNITTVQPQAQDEVAIESMFRLHQEYIGIRADRRIAGFLSHHQHANAAWSYERNDYIAAELKPTADYIIALLTAFLEKHDWSKKDARLIRDDAVRKLWDISKLLDQRASRRRAWRLKLRAMATAPHQIPARVYGGIKRRFAF